LGVNEEFHIISDQAILESCRLRYKLPEKFILFVGLLEPRKNLPLLLKAYAQLLKIEDAPRLVIVGRPGWGYKEILQQIDVLNLKDKVHFTGYVPAQDMPIVYNLAQVFVYPSIYEGFGLPPMEAMACGTPVITTDVSALRDHVGEAGILIPSQDEEALVQAMRKILLDPDLRKLLSLRGRQQVANFTWKRTALETLKVYQYVASKRASTSPSAS
jgi:glycosyltransferase involved in cell wall biosynthesis